MAMTTTKQEQQRTNTVGNANAFFSRAAVQPKLSINSPGDVYEQEADAMADKVMRMKTPSSQSFFKPAPSSVQRKCQHCEDEDKMLHRKENSSAETRGNASLNNYVNSLGASGQSLSAASRQFFEPRFGHDFSNVKIHNDGVAAKSAQSINALAYTTGNNIVFNQGQYAPNSESGQRLMAHELTHVVQQGGSKPNAAVQRKEVKEHGDIKDVTYDAIGDCDRVGGTAPGKEKEQIVPGVKYAVDSDKIDPALARALNLFVHKWHARGAKERVSIYGYASTDGPEGYNWTLSCKRANSVKQILLNPTDKSKGIDETFITTDAQGETNKFGVNENDLPPNRVATIVSTVPLNPDPVIPPEPEKPKKPEKPPAHDCDAGVAATTINDYVNLVTCLEKALSYYTPRQILSLLRQLYYSDQSWSKCSGNGCKFWSDVIPCGLPVADPQPGIGANLYNALINSQVVAGVDMGHVFTGLESMVCPTSNVELNVPGPNWTTNVSNEEFSTWAGDLGSAVAGKAHDEFDEDMGPQPWSNYFDTPNTLASSEDLTGDIDSYVMRVNLAGGTCAGSAMKPIINISSPISTILFDYYNGNAGAAGQSQNNRIECFIQALGGQVVNKKIANKGTFTPFVKKQTFEFGNDYYDLKYHHAYFSSFVSPVLLSAYSDQLAVLFTDWLENKL